MLLKLDKKQLEIKQKKNKLYLLFSYNNQDFLSFGYDSKSDGTKFAYVRGKKYIRDDYRTELKLIGFINSKINVQDQMICYVNNTGIDINMIDYLESIMPHDKDCSITHYRYKNPRI